MTDDSYNAAYVMLAGSVVAANWFVHDAAAAPPAEVGILTVSIKICVLLDALRFSLVRVIW